MVIPFLPHFLLTGKHLLPAKETECVQGSPQIRMFIIVLCGKNDISFFNISLQGGQYQKANQGMCMSLVIVVEFEFELTHYCL